jgi:peptidoglycan/LPS O-acetylase OafA/YrhL
MESRGASMILREDKQAVGRISLDQSCIASTPQSASAVRRFGLDIARAAAIVLVLVSHGIGYWGPLVGDKFFDLSGIFRSTGVDGVELFFSLSGFLIGGLLLDIQRRKPSADSIKIFLLRRWMRTLPLYYLVLIAFFIFPQIEPNPQQRVWSYALLVQNLVTPMPASNWFGPSWSLVIEEWSYLALPFLAFYVCRSTRNPVGCAALILIAVGNAGRLTVGLAFAPSSLDKIALLRSDAVAYGVLGAVLAETYGHIFTRGTLLLAIALIGSNIWITYAAEYVRSFAVWLILFPMTAIGFTLLLPGLARLPTPKTAAFVAPIQFLARISYTLYLIHWSFMYIASTVPPPFQLLVYIAGSLLVAALLSYAIEYPIMRLRPKQV